MFLIIIIFIGNWEGRWMVRFEGGYMISSTFLHLSFLGCGGFWLASTDYLSIWLNVFFFTLSSNYVACSVNKKIQTVKDLLK